MLFKNNRGTAIIGDVFISYDLQKVKVKISL
jgi:hypothetical protein